MNERDETMRGLIHMRNVRHIAARLVEEYIGGEEWVTLYNSLIDEFQEFERVENAPQK